MAAKQCVLVARVTVDGNGQMVEVICDGRDCKVCAAKDSDNDLVFANQAFCWAYVPLLGTNRNRGRVCFYCYRVFVSQYEVRGVNLNQMISQLQEQDEHKRFFDCRMTGGAGSLQVSSKTTGTKHTNS